MNNNKADSMPLDTEKEITFVSKNSETICETNLKRKKSLPSHFADYIGFKIGNSELKSDIKIKSKNNAHGKEDYNTFKKYKTKKQRCPKSLQKLDNGDQFNMNGNEYDLPKSFEKYDSMLGFGKDNNLIKYGENAHEPKNTPDNERKVKENHIGLNNSKCCVCFSSIEGSKLIGPPLSNLLPCTQLSCHQFMLLLGINLNSFIGNSEQDRIPNNKSKESKFTNIKYGDAENLRIPVPLNCNEICKRCFDYMKKGDKAYKQLYDIYMELKKLHPVGEKDNLYEKATLNKPVFKLYDILTGKYKEKDKEKAEIIERNINNISLSEKTCMYCKKSYTYYSEHINHLKTYHNIVGTSCNSVSNLFYFNKQLLYELDLNLEKYKCIACKRCDFVSKEIFLVHLLNDHRINVNYDINGQYLFEIPNPEPSVDLVHGYNENLNSKEDEQVMITIKSEPNIDFPRIKSITKMPKVLSGKKFDVTKLWNCNECSGKFISEDALNNHFKLVGHSFINHQEKKVTQPANMTIENIKKHKETKTKQKINNRKIHYKRKIKGKRKNLVLDKNDINEMVDIIDNKKVSLKRTILNNIEDNPSSIEIIKGSNDNDMKDLSLKAENGSIQNPHVDEYQNNDIITHELIVLECEECGSRFLNHTALGLHMTRIHGHPRKLDKVFSCHKCDYKAPTNGKLKTHLKAVHGIENSDKSQCHECGGFYTPNFIKKHIENMHSNKCEHVCRFCNMKFRAEYLMKAHIASEHLNNRWRCDICDQEFDKYHRMRMHKIHQHQTTSFLCTHCDKSFKRKGDLTAHTKRAHMKKEEFKCIYCPRSYLDKGKYRNHLINKHNVPWHKTISKNYCKILRENNMLKIPPQQKKPTQSRKINDKQERATVAEAVGYLQTIDKVKLDGEDLQNEDHYNIIEVILENQ